MKRLSTDQARDRAFVKEYLDNFLMAIREENRDDAQEAMDNIAGTLQEMHDRIPEDPAV